MPLFQYFCSSCETESEILVRGADAPKCPQCGSDSLVRQASMFNALNGGTKREMAPAPCGMASCCGGGCALN